MDVKPKTEYPTLITLDKNQALEILTSMAKDMSDKNESFDEKPLSITAFNSDHILYTYSLIPDENNEFTFVVAENERASDNHVPAIDTELATLMEDDPKISMILPQPRGRRKSIVDPLDSKKKKLVCPQCLFETTHKPSYLGHLMTHSKEKPYKCSECDKCFKSIMGKRQHELGHKGIKPHKCLDCEDRFFTSQSELQRHVRYVHTKERAHKCPDCNYACVEYAKLRRHIQAHIGYKPFACSECTYRCVDNFKLKRHMRVHTGERPYKCPKCDRCFTQSNGRKAHIKDIHEKPNPSFKCHVCPYVTRRKTDLRIHFTNMHSTEHPFLCEFCNNFLPDKYAFTEHCKKHKDAGELVYKCDYCHFKHTKKVHYTKHMQKHIERGTMYSQCKVCDQKFDNRHQLDDHIWNEHLKKYENLCDPLPETNQESKSPVKISNNNVNNDVSQEEKNVVECNNILQEQPNNVELNENNDGAVVDVSNNIETSINAVIQRVCGKAESIQKSRPRGKNSLVVPKQKAKAPENKKNLVEDTKNLIVPLNDQTIVKSPNNATPIISNDSSLINDSLIKDNTDHSSNVNAYAISNPGENQSLNLCQQNGGIINHGNTDIVNNGSTDENNKENVQESHLNLTVPYEFFDQSPAIFQTLSNLKQEEGVSQDYINGFLEESEAYRAALTGLYTQFGSNTLNSGKDNCPSSMISPPLTYNKSVNMNGKIAVKSRMYSVLDRSVSFYNKRAPGPTNKPGNKSFVKNENSNDSSPTTSSYQPTSKRGRKKKVNNTTDKEMYSTNPIIESTNMHDECIDLIPSGDFAYINPLNLECTDLNPASSHVNILSVHDNIKDIESVLL